MSVYTHFYLPSRFNKPKEKKNESRPKVSMTSAANPYGWKRKGGIEIGEKRKERIRHQ
jgi:hypothetical protein